jgi:hypothetical protein
MDSTRPIYTNKCHTNKWTAGTVAALLGATLLLSACGGSSEPVVETTPAVATVAPAAGSSSGSTATETPEAAATEASTSGTEGTTVITDTGTLTDTEVMTNTEVTTATIETNVLTRTSVITGTDVTTETDVMTDTSGVSGTESVSETSGAANNAGATTQANAAAGATAGTLMGVTGVDSHQYVRASTLLDYDFDNADGNVSGDLEDLLIDLTTGRVLFASIEYGGVLDLGDKDIVVPLNAFKTDENGGLVLNIDENSLNNYPDVGNDWPDLSDPTWDDAVNKFWSDTGIDVGQGITEQNDSVAWASDLVGKNVADLGNGAGSILDLLVNLGTGYAPYAIVDYGEGLDTNPYIIPLAAFDVSDWNNGLTYGPDFTPDLLEKAPRFDQSAYPDGASLDEDFGTKIESAWNDLGFSNDLNNNGQINR